MLVKNPTVAKLEKIEDSLFNIAIGNTAPEPFFLSGIVKRLDAVLMNHIETSENYMIFWTRDTLKAAVKDDFSVMSAVNTGWRAVRDFRKSFKVQYYEDGKPERKPRLLTNIPTNTNTTTKEPKAMNKNTNTEPITTSEPIPPYLVVKDLNDFRHYGQDCYSILTNDFNNVGKSKVFGHVVDGSKTVLLIVDKDTKARRLGYLVDNEAVIDKSRALFAVYKKDNAPFPILNAFPVDNAVNAKTRSLEFKAFFVATMPDKYATLERLTEVTTTKKEEVQTMTTNTNANTNSNSNTNTQLLTAKWGRLKNARKDVVKRFFELRNETIAAFAASTHLSKLQKITSENVDFDSDARKLASRVYSLLMEIINTPEPTTEKTTPETVDTKETETKETGTKEETTIEVEPAAYIVKGLFDFRLYDGYSILTSLEESDKLDAPLVAGYAVNGADIVGAFVNPKTSAPIHGYLVKASAIVDKARAVFAYYPAANAPADLLGALSVFANKDGKINLETVTGYLVPVNMNRPEPPKTEPENITTKEEVNIMEQNETTNPAPRLSLKKDNKPAPRVNIGTKLNDAVKRYNKRQEENAAFIRSIKDGEKNETVNTVKPAPVNVVNAVKDVNPVDNKTTAETIDKSAVYIWKDGKKHFAKTPGKRPSDACLSILRQEKGYFDKCTGKWVFTHGLPTQAIDALKRNGARVVESAELVPGYDPAKLDLADRILYEWKRGRVSWLEGCRFNLTYRPASYFDGHTLSARNSELCFNLPTYFLTRSTAKKIAEETGLEITLKENSSGFPVRVPRFENDEENEDVETLAGFRWEIAYPQEAFKNLPQKQFNAPDVPSLETIAERIGAALGENLLDALRRRLANAPELANLYPERRALALDVAACVLLASFGLNPADYAGDISAYRAKFSGAVLAQNGVKVAINKAKELARRVGKEMGLPIVEDAAAPAKA